MLFQNYKMYKSIVKDPWITQDVKYPSGRAYHLPHLHDVVLWHRTDDPWLIGVPGKVWDLSCVSAMDELGMRAGVISTPPTIQLKPESVNGRSPATPEGHPQRPLATAPLRSYSGPRRWVACLCRWRPESSHYEETTEPVNRRQERGEKKPS